MGRPITHIASTLTYQRIPQDVQEVLERLEIQNEVLEHEFPVPGYRSIFLNTRRVEQTENKPFKILLAMEVFDK